MKFSAAIILASLASTSAFTTRLASKPATSLRMSEPTPEDSEPISEPVAQEDPYSVDKPLFASDSSAEMSMALPFMERPSALDGSMAGDVGFDPLGFAKSEQDLMNYREAEIKHARLAMLAAAGWPLSEVFDKKIASALNLPAVVDAADRAPSVLNGGLGKVSPVYWAACLIGAAAVEAYGLSQKGKADYFPGKLGFDPLGLYPSDEAGQMRMQTTEIKNGRLAMIAITAFAAQEFVSKLGVVDETPFFFKPIGSVLTEYANSGYIAH